MDGPRAPRLQLCFILSNKAALFRIDLVLAQIWRWGYEEFSPPLSFRVKFPSIQIPEVKRPVWIKQQGIQRYTHHRLVSAMLLQRVFHVLFKFLVAFLQWSVHLHADHVFAVGRQSTGTVSERN